MGTYPNEFFKSATISWHLIKRLNAWSEMSMLWLLLQVALRQFSEASGWTFFEVFALVLIVSQGEEQPFMWLLIMLFAAICSVLVFSCPPGINLTWGVSLWTMLALSSRCFFRRDFGWTLGCGFVDSPVVTCFFTRGVKNHITKHKVRVKNRSCHATVAAGRETWIWWNWSCTQGLLKMM